MSNKSNILVFPNNKFVSIIFESSGEFSDYIQDRFNVKMIVRGNQVSVLGSKKESLNVIKLLKNLAENLELGIELSIDKIDSEIYKIYSESETFQENKVVLNTTKRKIKPLFEEQEKFIELLFDKEIVFATGVAGTGKTYLSVAMAVHMYLLGEVEKIILTRPVVEAGEKLGFLPGDLKEKMDPYMQPLYDSLYDMLPVLEVNRCLENNIFEIIPLAFMRGRTIKNAYVILDEAQNTVPSQMKMFLTRLGIGSRMVISGDLSQKDLPVNQKSGLSDALEKLNKTEDIGIINFTSKNVVRHKLVSKIIDCYEKKS